MIGFLGGMVAGGFLGVMVMGLLTASRYEAPMDHDGPRRFRDVGLL